MPDEKAADGMDTAGQAGPEKPAAEDSPRKEAQPSGKAECSRFHAATPWGSIAFTLWPAGESSGGEEPDAAAPVLRAAQQLGQAEPLVCMLETWLDLPMDFSPGDQAEPDPGQLEVTLSPAFPDDNDGMTRAVLGLPRAILSRLPPPVPELAGQMRWGILPCQLEMASMVIPPRQLDRLESGGMVLIPVSFESFWRCQVRICNTDPSPVFLAELDAGRQRLIFDLFEPSPEQAPLLQEQVSFTVARESAEDKGVSGNPAGELTNIVLQHLLPVPADRLFGWAEQPVFALGQLLSGAGVVLYHAGQPLADGELVPVGGGYGVLIKNVMNETGK